MLISDLETDEVQADLSGSVEQAERDVSVAAADHRSSESALNKSQSEVHRLQTLYGKVQSQITVLTRDLKDARRKAFVAVTEEKLDADATPFKTVEILRLRRQRALDSLSYLVTFAISDANVDELRRQVDERAAYADLLESEAASVRLKLSLAAQSVLQIDPGSVLSLTSPGSRSEPGDTSVKSRSVRLMEHAIEIRTRTIGDLKERLKKAEDEAAREQATVGAGLWV